MTETRGVWEIRLGIYATPEQAEVIQERVSRALCPDPDHAPPCPIPWSLSLVDESGLEVPGLYAELEEQARLEGPLDA